MNEIIRLASRPEGVSQQELMSAMGGKSQSAVSRALDRIGDAITKAGVKDYHRYFTDKDQAAEYQVTAEIDRERRIKESIEKTRIAEKIRMQKRRDQIRALKPPAPHKPPKPPKKPTMTAEQRKERDTERQRAKRSAKRMAELLEMKPKAQNIVIESPQQAIDKKRAHLKAQIEWPESVKVQVIPGFKGDTRYKPEPGYMGSFTKEWQERRAA